MNREPSPILHLSRGGILAGLLVLALMHAVYFFRTLLLPVAIALLLALALLPLIRFMRRFRIPDAVGAVAAVLLIVCVAGAGAYLLAEPAGEWIDRVPFFVRQIEFKMGTFLTTIQQAKEASRKIQGLTDSPGDSREVVVKGPSLSDQLYTSAKSLVLSVGVVIVLLYFILAYGQRTLERMSADRPQSRLAPTIDAIERDVSTYFGTLTIINTILGIVTGGVMALLGMPNPVLWGALAGLLNYIPYLGPAIAISIFTVVAVISFEHWFRMALPPACFLLLTTLEGQFITPTVLGRRLTINPLLVVLSIFFWGWMWGVPGVILALPFLSALKSISEKVPSLHLLRELFD